MSTIKILNRIGISYLLGLVFVVLSAQDSIAQTPVTLRTSKLMASMKSQLATPVASQAPPKSFKAVTQRTAKLMASMKSQLATPVASQAPPKSFKAVTQRTSKLIASMKSQ